jgi:hypothetical protein
MSGCQRSGRRRALACAVVSFALPCVTAAPANAAEDAGGNEWALTGGVKLWATSWESWIVVPTVFNKASRDVVETINSSTELAAIPQASVRYGNWLASASGLISTGYTFKPSWGSSLAASRYEIDGNVGYYVLPGLALTAGYKQIDQKFGGTYKWRGPTAGLSGTGGLGHGFSVYGAVGVGFMKGDLPFADGAGRTRLNASYFLGEAGIAYSFGNIGWLTRSLNVTLGYRSQTLTTKGYDLADTNTSPATISRQDVHDTTHGATLSVIAVL